MTIATLFSIIAIILGLGMAMTANSLLASALFPQWTSRASQRVGNRPSATLVIGVVTGGLVIAAGLSLLRGGGPAGLLGALLLASAFAFAMVGSSGVAAVIGRRLPSAADADRPWKATIRGWVVVLLASLAPIFGWFIVLPAMILTGFGAALLGLPRRSRVQVQPDRTGELPMAAIALPDEVVAAAPQHDSLAAGIGK